MPLISTAPSKLRSRASVREMLLTCCPDVRNIRFDSFERVVGIDMADGGTWHRFQFEPDTASLSQRATRDGGAENVSVEISWKLPALNADTRQAIRRLTKQGCLHALVRDANQRWHYVGVSYIAERREWLSENMRTGNREASTGDNPRSQRSGYTTSLACVCESDSPLLAADFDFSGLTIIEPDPFRLPETDPPIHILLNPFSGNTGVDAATRTTFQATFNEPILWGASGLTARLRRLSDNLLVHTWTNINNNSSSFQISGVYRLFMVLPSPLLQYGTEYYIEIEPGLITDVHGNPHAGISQPIAFGQDWTFRTIDDPNALPPPVLISYEPQGIVSNDPSTVIQATYNQPMLPGSGNIYVGEVGGGLVLLLQPNDPVISYNGNNVVFDLYGLFAPQTEYEIYWDAGAFVNYAFQGESGLVSGIWTFQFGSAVGLNEGFDHTLDFDFI